MIQEIKLLSDFAEAPTKGIRNNLCWELYSPKHTVIPPREQRSISTDVALSWNDSNYYIQILSKPELIDHYNIYAKEIIIEHDNNDTNIHILLTNNSNKDYIVDIGDRIAQYIFVKKISIESNITQK